MQRGAGRPAISSGCVGEHSGRGEGMDASLIAALAACATAAVSTYQVRLLRKQLAEDSRPYVVVDVVPGLHGQGFWDLTLESTGRSIAHRARVATSPATWVPGEDDHITEPLRDYLNGEHDLPPGARHRVMWRYESTDEPACGAPSQVSVRVTFEDEKGRSYVSSLRVDTNVLGKVSPVAHDGPRMNGIEEGRELMNIDRAIRALTEHVGELRR